MSDEEESMSEGFSASEDEWKPTKDTRGGESSDDDDSDFESSPIAAAVSSSSTGKKKEPKARSATKQTASKKRPGLSLRAKLYNKYRPLPKTLSPPSSGGKNSPTASTSRSNSKNAKTPNESSRRHRDDDDEGSSSDGSIDNYLVNPEQLDIQSSFFDVGTKLNAKKSSVSPVPDFDCNAGLGNLSESVSEEDAENNESDNFVKKEDTKVFNFQELLENAKSLERVKESLAKHAAEEAAAKKKGTPSKSLDDKLATMDVYSILALGERPHRSHNDGEDEDDEEEEEDAATADKERRGKGPSKLSKTKSTRVKRHTKTRPASTVVAEGDTDDSDFEEVPDNSDNANTTASEATDISHQGNLEIYVELPSRHSEKKTRTQQELELALKRKLNREIKERQLLMHKASLLCHFGRTYIYNRLLNDSILMQKALKLLPSSNAYPPDRGTEIKYYQSLITWYKSAITLKSQNLYPDKKRAKTRAAAHTQLLKQIEKKEAESKQDMVFIFIILLRGMGLQCRLVNNIQPLPLKPSQSDLCTIKMKQEPEDQGKNATIKKISEKKACTEISPICDGPSTSAQAANLKQKTKSNETRANITKQDSRDKSTEIEVISSKGKVNIELPKNKDRMESTTKTSSTASRKVKTVEAKGKKGLASSNTTKQSAAKLNKKPITSSADEPEGVQNPHVGSKKLAKTGQSKANPRGASERQFIAQSTNQSPTPKKDTAKTPDIEDNVAPKEQIKAAKGTVSKSKAKISAKHSAASENEVPMHREQEQKNAVKNEDTEDKEAKVTSKKEQVKATKCTVSKSKAEISTKHSAASENEVPMHREQEQKNAVKKEDTEDKEVKVTSKKEQVKATKCTVSKSKAEISTKHSAASENEVPMDIEQEQRDDIKAEDTEDLENSQKENSSKSKANLARLKRTKTVNDKDSQNKKKRVIEPGTPLIPEIVVKGGKQIINNTTTSADDPPTTSTRTRVTRSRSKSPQVHISVAFMHTKQCQAKFPGIVQQNTNVKDRQVRGKSPADKVQISTHFLANAKTANKRILRSRKKTNEIDPSIDSVPQMDGANDDEILNSSENSKKQKATKKKTTKKLKSTADSEEDFEPSPIKKPKLAPGLARKDRRVLSTDDEDNKVNSKQKPTAGDMWVEVWCDVEEQWVCVDLFKGKIHCVDTIRKSASTNLAYVFAFQNDLSVKDVTARYCPNWTTVVRKSRIDKAWLDNAIYKYQGHRTKRDIIEDQELRRIHEMKPMPTAIGDYKNHPFYALERHLLKFEAIYPPNAPTLGYIRKEAVYSRDCVHTLHSRDIWLKQARVVKLGEKPYKIVKARPKWDRITQTVIKDQPLEIFGYWQTEEYDPPTAENGMVPRNAYGNVELFKPTMLPKKCVHIRLPGLNRICKKLGVDCANAVVGFDFHQGACHPTYDGFVVCEEFQDQVTAAWYQDQEEQERKQEEKYQARVYGNWKKLIQGLIIRERLKAKYNF